MKRRSLLLSALAGMSALPSGVSASPRDMDVASAINRIHLSAMLSMAMKDRAGARRAAEELYVVRQYSDRWNTHAAAFLIGVILMQVTPEAERAAHAKACMTVLDCYEVALIYGNLEENLRAIAVAGYTLLKFESAGQPVPGGAKRRVATLALAFAGLAFGPDRKTWARTAVSAVKKYGSEPVRFWDNANATARMLAAGTAASGDWVAAARQYEDVVDSPGARLETGSFLGRGDQVGGLWGVMAGSASVDAEAGSIIGMGVDEKRGLLLLERSRDKTLSRARATPAQRAVAAASLEDELTRQGVVVVQPICSWAGCFASVALRRGGKLEQQAAFNPFSNSCELFFRLVTTQNLFLAPKDGLLPSYIGARKRTGEKRVRMLTAYVERAAAIAEILVGQTVRSVLKGARVGPDQDVLIILPASLALLPIGLAQAKPGAPRLMEEFRLRYAESLLGAKKALNAARPATTVGLLTSNPAASDLRHIGFELACVAANATAAQRIGGGVDVQSTFASFGGANYWHVACHANWDFAKPERSGIALARKSTATVEGVLSARITTPPRLVYLSACETGLIDIRKDLNDFVGLPSAFLAMGATGVIGTLWAVSDAASSLLASRFYDLHWGERRAPADALRRAQLWLSTSSAGTLQDYVVGKVAAGKLKAEDASSMSGFLADLSAEHVPFAHPYYWGGFQLYGA